MRRDAVKVLLREAMLWIREHTEPNAVLVANAFTPENMKKDHWGALDRTLMGVHFYYSALSERRLWFEGPAYHTDATRHRIRANMASNFFYRGGELPPAVVNGGPSYILRDRSLHDGADLVGCTVVTPETGNSNRHLGQAHTGHFNTKLRPGREAQAQHSNPLEETLHHGGIIPRL